MKHSKQYSKVRMYYVTGMWDISRVRNAVVKKWITEEEFYEITNTEY